MLASSVAHSDGYADALALPPSAALVLDLALARCAVPGGATAAEISRDIAPYFAHRYSPSEWRDALAEARTAIERANYASDARGRLTLTDDGIGRVKAWLNIRDLSGDWADLRDQHVTARALGQPDMPATRRRMLARPDGLRMAIVQKAYGLKLRRVPTPARVRAALAGVALKRAFGNKMGPDFSVDGGVDARSSRLLAGQLARRPQDFGTDTRLIATLAAEAIGALQQDVATLRLILLRQLVSEAFGQGPGNAPSEPATVRNRPDIQTFAATVKSAADSSATGWSGSRKAFIGVVWDALKTRHPDWGLTEIEFKSMLIEAHRNGLIVLANADLKSSADREEVQRSATTFKNTVWHLIRLEG